MLTLEALTDKEFGLFAKLVYDRAGIHLPLEKRTLLSNRLRGRLRALGLSTFAEYYTRLGDEAFIEEELPSFLSAITTNEAYFFRNDRLWELFTERLVPEFVQRNESKSRSIKLWSAACSSGEEAHTAAIVLRELVPDFARWRVSVIGTDISKKVLDKAQKAVYDEYAVAKMSPERRARWFTPCEGKFKLSDEIRKLARFQLHNLKDPFPHTGFDLVLLRNVLMYFDTSMKQRAIQVASDAVAPGGYLYIGDVDPTRTSRELMDVMRLKPEGPGLYHRPAGTSAFTAAKEPQE